VFLRRLWGESANRLPPWAVGRIDDPVAAAYWRCGVSRSTCRSKVSFDFRTPEGEPVAEVSV
jgi:hypothetical protein